jgi:ubiquinone/menaquinone biosynthesis C-methylase UbiE
VAAATELLPGAELRVADARALPFEDGSISIVAMLTCLSSMPDDVAIATSLRQARRVCAEDGLVLVYEPRLPNPFNRATRTVGEALLTANLGQLVAKRHLSGFPPLARRLSGLTSWAYPALARSAPTHRLSVHAPGAVRKPHE